MIRALAPTDGAPASEPEDCEEAEQRKELQHRHEDRIEPSDVECPVDDRPAPPAELRCERLPGAEPFHDADPHDGLLDEGGGLAPALLQPLRPCVVSPGVRPACEAGQRERDEHDQCEAPIDHEQHGGNGEHRQQVADRVTDRIHHAGDVLGVRRRAAHQLSRPDAVVIARVESQRVREDRVANTRVRLGSVADCVQVADGTGGHLEQSDAEERRQPEQQGVMIALQHAVVDRLLDHQRRGDRADLPEQARESGADDAACLRADHGAHESPRCAPSRVVNPHG